MKRIQSKSLNCQTPQHTEIDFILNGEIVRVNLAEKRKKRLNFTSIDINDMILFQN